MKRLFVIDDEAHCESQGEFSTMEEAVAELQRLALIPWNKEPNAAPCSNWERCGRDYQVIEYDTDSEPWEEIKRTPMLYISANAVRWTPVARDTASLSKVDKKALKDQFTQRFSQVRKVLMKEWDPIGVNDAIEAEDEYDTYVNQILSMPKEEVTMDSLASYLMMVRNELIGLPPNEEKDKEIATKLLLIL